MFGLQDKATPNLLDKSTHIRFCISGIFDFAVRLSKNRVLKEQISFEKIVIFIYIYITLIIIYFTVTIIITIVIIIIIITIIIIIIIIIITINTTVLLFLLLMLLLLLLNGHAVDAKVTCTVSSTAYCYAT